jgi:hypothetical protein
VTDLDLAVQSQDVADRIRSIEHAELRGAKDGELSAFFAIGAPLTYPSSEGNSVIGPHADKTKL